MQWAVGGVRGETAAAVCRVRGEVTVGGVRGEAAGLRGVSASRLTCLCCPFFLKHYTDHLTVVEN